MKHTAIGIQPFGLRAAAFGRLCVETGSGWVNAFSDSQPPSGGCVLKLLLSVRGRRLARAAAFGRLCVETGFWAWSTGSCRQPPSGGCVLKPAPQRPGAGHGRQPPSGGCVLKPARRCGLAPGRLQPPSGGCVLKLAWRCRQGSRPSSRLRAAVC